MRILYSEYTHTAHCSQQNVTHADARRLTHARTPHEYRVQQINQHSRSNTCAAMLSLGPAHPMRILERRYVCVCVHVSGVVQRGLTNFVFKTAHKRAETAKNFFACGGLATGGACGGLKPFSLQGIFWCTYWERHPS